MYTFGTNMYLWGTDMLQAFRCTYWKGPAPLTALNSISTKRKKIMRNVLTGQWLHMLNHIVGAVASAAFPAPASWAVGLGISQRFASHFIHLCLLPVLPTKKKKVEQLVRWVGWTRFDLQYSLHLRYTMSDSEDTFVNKLNWRFI